MMLNAADNVDIIWIFGGFNDLIRQLVLGWNFVFFVFVMGVNCRWIRYIVLQADRLTFKCITIINSHFRR